MEQGIYQRLSADTGVSAALAGGAIYPVILPDELTGNALSYQLISKVPQYALEGTVATIRARLQIDCWAPTYASATALSQAVSASLDLYRGTLPDGTRVLNIQHGNSQNLYDSDSQLYRIQQDWVIVYVPT